MDKLQLALKAIARRRLRSALIILGAAMSIFLFCVIGSIQAGLDSLLGQKEANRRLVVFQENKFCPATSQLPEIYAEELKKMDEVVDAIPIQVFTNNCRASLDVVVFIGLPANKLQQIRNLELQQGNWDEFLQYGDSAVIGSDVARRRGISVGDTFSIGSYTVKIAGVFKSDNPAEESYFYTHLDYLQYGSLTNGQGMVTQFEVVLNSSADALALQEEIDDLFSSAQIATDTRTKGAFQQKSLGDLAHVIQFSSILGYACVGLLFVLLATTSLMGIQDRMKELAVMKVLGFSRIAIFQNIVAETTVVGFLGGLIGVITAALLVTLSPLSLSAEAVTIAFVASWQLSLKAILISMIGAVAAGTVPAWVAARHAPLSALQEA
ncbi:MAG: ABC transporter substrate-binding protein [Planctomycetaceae bacterium]|nr:ABC transporter substrate-binding protein [Planctomycetaceae bacterium]